jgi:pantothenate kinase type III
MDEMKWDKCNIIVTGGFGGLISPHLKTKHNYLPNLTLDGIRIIYGKNSPGKIPRL